MANPTAVNTSGTGTASCANAGWKLKQIRERLNLTLRAVEECSLGIADTERNSEFAVSIARLNQIENDGSLPSIFKLYSLAAVYRMSLDQVLVLYGIDVTRMEEHRLKMHLTHTHLLATGDGDPARLIRFPVRFDPGFRPEKTAFLSRLIESWGEIPVGLLATLDLKKYRYGYIGLNDRTMAPLIRPGCIVQIDDTRRRVVNEGWVSEADRPIYFVELRYSYECCWCSRNGRESDVDPSSPIAVRPAHHPHSGRGRGARAGGRSRDAARAIAPTNLFLSASPTSTRCFCRRVCRARGWQFSGGRTW